MDVDRYSNLQKLKSHIPQRYRAPNKCKVPMSVQRENSFHIRKIIHHTDWLQDSHCDKKIEFSCNSIIFLSRLRQEFEKNCTLVSVRIGFLTFAKYLKGCYFTSRSSFEYGHQSSFPKALPLRVLIHTGRMLLLPK